MLWWGQFHVTFQMVIILDTWINHTNVSKTSPRKRWCIWVTVDVKYAVYSLELTLAHC